MNFRRMFGILGLVLSVGVEVVVQAQATDLQESLSNALRTFGPVPITRSVQTPVKQPVCDLNPNLFPPVLCREETVYVQQDETVNDILTVSNIKISSNSEIEWGEKIRTEFPSQMIVTQVKVQNCVDAPQPPVSQTLLQTFTRSVGMTFSHSVTHSESYNIGFHYNFNLAFGISGGVTFGQNETVGESKVLNSGESLTFSKTVPLSVPPHETYIAELRIYPITYSVPFRMTVTVDGDLIKNNRGFTNLSDIFDKSKRTFVVSGTLEATDSSEANVIIYRLADPQPKCPGGSQLLVDPKYIPKAGQRVQRINQLR